MDILNNLNINFPPQMIPLSEKNTKWRNECMNALEYRGRIQCNENLKLIDGYRLINGEFLPKEYGDEMVEYAKTIDFDVDYSSVKHYDILSQPINTAIGELDTYQNVFNIVGKGEKFTNSRMRVKQELFKNYLVNKIETEVNNKVKLKMAEEGIQETEENQEQVSQLKDEIMSPMEIEKWINTKYQHVVLIWANIEFDDQQERFKMHDLRRVEFRDMLITNRRFRHIYLKGDSFDTESWNPVNTFYHKSPEEQFIQNGDFVGRITLMTLSDIIDRFGYLMTDDEIKSLTQLYAVVNSNAIVKKHPDGSTIKENSPYGLPYNTFLPTNSVELNQIFGSQAFGGNALIVTAEQLDAIDGGKNHTSLQNMFQVTEAFWKSQKILYKIVYIDEETNQLTKVIVDENFVIPKHFKIKTKKPFYSNEDEDEINTATKTRDNEIWQGIKISNFNHSLLVEPMYLNIKPHDLQFKGKKLPVAGQVLNNRNVVGKSPIFKAKPYQFLYNVCMNQIYKLLEQELAPFLMIDPNMLPNDKGWGGKDNITKWVKTADASSIAVTDSSSQNGDVNRNNAYPKVIDMGMASRLMNRIELAGAFRQLALQQLGFSDQRLGSVKASETATGVNQAVTSSSVQTSHLFNDFYSCEADIIAMQLSVAQQLQSKGTDITAQYTKSDRSIAMLQFNDEEFDLYELHCYPSNRQENIRQLDFARRLGIENNTLLTNMSDRLTMGTSNNIPEILEVLLSSEKEMNTKQAQQQQIQQQQIDQQKEQFDIQTKTQSEQFYANLENELQKELIRVQGYASEETNTSPSILDQMKFMSDDSYKNKTLDLKREESTQSKSLKEKELDIKAQSLNLEILKQNNDRVNKLIDLKRTVIQGDKSQ